MSTLFVNTIYPDSGSSVNISGSLIISQSLIVADNITMSGSIKLGDADTDSVSLTAEISSSIIPDADLTYNLGSSAKKWNKLHVGNITASHNISSSGIVYGAVGQFDELTLPPFTTITASGGISAASFVGDGSQLTGVGSTGSVLDVVSVSVDTFVSGAGTGSFNHFFVSGEISGSVSASGTGSFQGGVNAAGTNSTFGNITASGNISASGYVFSNNLVLPVDEGGAEEARIVFSKNWTGNVSNQKGDNGYIFDDDQSIQIGYADSDYVAIGHQDPTNTDSDGMRIYLQTGVRVKGSVSASGTGSFQHGIDAAGATGSFGMISASGDISASGTGSFEFLTVPGEVSGNISASGTGSFAGGIDCIGDGTGMSPASGAFGYISSSGEITSITASMDHLILSGSSSMGYMFISASDELNYTISSSGTISSSYFAGDGRYLFNVTASVGVANAHGSDTFVQFNDGGTNLGSDSGLRYNKSTDTLSISGSLIVGGNGTPGLGAVSASRVSASLGFEADTLSTSSFGFISCSGDISSSGTGSFAGGINCISPGGDNVDGTGSFGYISCSGDISMSGTLAVDGNMTASGTISGSLLKGQSVQAQQGDSLGFRFNLNNDSVVNALRYKEISTVGHADINALPLTVTKDISGSANLLIGGTARIEAASTLGGAITANGALNVKGGFQIGEVAVTATAAELNVMDGFLGTTDQLNAFIKTSDADIEPSKAVKYDSEGAVRSKKVIKSSGATLTAGDSDALLAPSGSDAQTFTLPAVSDAKGVRFEFVAASAAAHIIQSEASDIFGQIIDNSNAATLARTELEGSSRIILQNPKIGDRITIISDGSRYFVEGRTNDTPGLA